MDTAPRLSHVGLYVRDVPKMIDFYTQVLGFVVSDGAEDGRITFLSRNPSDHHQVVLVRGRQTEDEIPMVQQVSFNVGTLPQVQKAFRKVRDAGCEGIRPICHGNAWSVYFQDPEGNPVIGAVVRMFQAPTMGPLYEIGESFTDSNGDYDMFLVPATQAGTTCTCPAQP